MKNKLETIKQKIRSHKRIIDRKFKVKQIGIFGSFVRGEQDRQSDVDLLVEFRRPIGLFKFMDLEDYLSKTIGYKVDLVSRQALKPRIGQRVLQEVEFI